MQQIVTPLLYTHIVDPGSLMGPSLLLRTVLENPGLAQLVKSFSVCQARKYWVFPSANFRPVAQFGYHPNGSLRLVSRWWPEVKDSIQPTIDTATVSLNLAYYAYPTRPDERFSSRWSRAISDSAYSKAWDATIALLLCLLPSLETLRLRSANDNRQHQSDGIKGFQFILRVLRSLKISDERIILPKLHTVHLRFLDCVLRKRLHRSLLKSIAPLNSIHYELLQVLDTWKSGSHMCREVDLTPRFIRARLLSGLEHSVEDLSVVARPNNSRLHFREETSQDANSYGIGSLGDYKKLKILTMSARILIGIPTVPAHLPWRSSFEDMMRGSDYTLEQEHRFYHGLPGKLEVLHIVDCPNAVYGCVKRFLQSSFIPPTLNRIEISYTHPRDDESAVVAMSQWLNNKESRWCGKFSGEAFATKSHLQDLASKMGIVLIQRIDKDYRWEQINRRGVGSLVEK
ncbi:hypothetical protein OIDMADRAFT_182915 [Oidiodendron maius Zn]|uniref:Uncharacterized protein n=1 Tax=Oidiodendron maius (strain Zn) TaxID=913774 RepID=A0A0C3H2I4_OIDMZ|nr:hypothetical protein OIDMADRAFT_182915 [Oidiodendron maius Zn]